MKSDISKGKMPDWGTLNQGRVFRRGGVWITSAGVFIFRVLQVVFRLYLSKAQTHTANNFAVTSSSSGSGRVPLGRDAPYVAQRGNQSGLGLGVGVGIGSSDS